MTTIPNMNIVIQQGDSVRESHNIRNQALEATQQTVFQRIEEDDRKRTVVGQLEETDKILLNKEQTEGGKRKPEKFSPRKKKKTMVKDDVFDPDEPGHLLNTIV